jgi:hypothetical protein
MERNDLKDKLIEHANGLRGEANFGYVEHSPAEVLETVALLEGAAEMLKASGDYADPDDLGLIQGADDVPRLVLGERQLAAFIPGSWGRVCEAMAAPSGYEPGEPTAIDGTWLWGKLMDWCRARRLSPAEYSDLFAIVAEARAAIALATSANLKEPQSP